MLDSMGHIVYNKRAVKQNDFAEGAMEKKVQLGWLFEFYGPLLTEHRREVMRLYCEEDCSLAEIASELGITRQGVHDAVSKSQAQLEGYEQKLGLIARYQRLMRAMADCRTALNEVQPAGGTEDRLKKAIRLLDEMEP